MELLGGHENPEGNPYLPDVDRVFPESRSVAGKLHQGPGGKVKRVRESMGVGGVSRKEEKIEIK